MSSEIADKLSEQTRGLVSRFEGRVARFAGRGDLLGLLRPLDREAADDFARSYFGVGEHLAIGIDGSRDFDERLQMMLFYANATGYSCSFYVGEEMTFDLARATRGLRLSASAAIPLWAEDFSDVLPDLPEVELELEYSMQRIPNSFMTLAELYLGIKATEKAKIVFMDRPLSGTYSTLARDARLLMKRGSTGLSRLPGQENRDTMMDLTLAINIGAPLLALPSRRRFATHRAIRELIRGELSRADLAARLSLDERQLSGVVKSLKRLDDKHAGGLLEDVDGGTIKLREGVKDYWNHSVALAESYAQRVYERGEPSLNLGGDEWLTILDVNTISLIMLQRLCQLSLQRKVVLVGIAKDTTATDISRAVLPFAESKGMVRLGSPAPGLNNDRAFLSVLSGMNREFQIPWRTAGYDSAFSTIFAPRGGEGRFMPARKVVSREELFVRGYFQSRSLGSSGKIRSQVFLFDRTFDPASDAGSLSSLEIEESSGPTTITPYYESDQLSPSSNLILRILSLTDNPEVYEAFGHNQLLYLADKAVKSEIRLMRSSLRGVADLRLGAIAKREQVYGIMTPYRDQRSEAEASRMREASRS
ncbi:MAG: hypothetical protein OK474_09655 [Thaumarchaeota archaeon]|nr:hypothetical protein [Nitrososphaerota archaeon]